MKIAFDPQFLADGTLREGWYPIFQDILSTHELVHAPDVERDEEVKGLVCFNLYQDPLEKFPNLAHVFSLMHGVNMFMRNEHLHERLHLYRMIDKGLVQAMREYVMSMVLRIHINHERYEVDQENGEWKQAQYIPPLASTRTIGFLGAGQLGATCSADMIHMGFPTICWSRSRKEIDGVTSYAGMDELDEFLSKTNTLVILAPLTPQTHNLLDKSRLSQLPEGASIINAGRGPLIVDEDLVALLDKGHIERAILDVFRKEPLPGDHPYWTHPKVFMTPHISAITQSTTSAEHVLNVANAIDKSEPPPGKVDRNLGY